MKSHISSRPGARQALLLRDSSSSGRNWILGSAVAAGAFSVPNVSARPTQITQDGSLRIPHSSLTFGVRTPVDSDFTGDGILDATGLSLSAFSGAAAVTTTSTLGKTLSLRYASARYASVFTQYKRLRAGGTTIGRSYQVIVNGMGDFETQPVTKTIIIGITFQDDRINDGQVTDGVVETRAIAGSDGPVVEFVRLIFDDESTILIGDTSGPLPEWESPAARAARLAQIASLNKKIKKLQRKARLAKRKKQIAKLKRFRKKIRALKKQVRALSSV